MDECPVDCIYEGEDQLYIHPEECVDCDACLPACPVDAIYPGDNVPAEWKEYVEKNAQFFVTNKDAAGGACREPLRPLRGAQRIGKLVNGSIPSPESNLGERVSMLFKQSGDPEHPFSEVVGVLMRVTGGGGPAPPTR